MERKALLVEDNENNRYLLTLLLKHAGLTVVAAGNGQSALEIARSEHPDVILLDIQMPQMDGYEVAAHLKRDVELARIPIIGVSSFAMPGDREKAIRMGFAGYIEKPVDPEHFAETVLSILGRAAGAP
ncbi:Polar-differentiation response regulator DivK [Candidatus Sulfopaludibacter sp. SbA3]|nr:Polar-differentiation response regulator DivK [Candidatus Sulfopaludibacter sp. SbA3]